MTTKFYECQHCRQLRIPEHMLGSICVFCPKPGRPHLASPPMPDGFVAVKRPPQDALDAQLRRMREAR